VISSEIRLNEGAAKGLGVRLTSILACCCHNWQGRAWQVWASQDEPGRARTSRATRSHHRCKSRNPPSLISIISLCCCALNIYQSQELVSFHPSSKVRKNCCLRVLSICLPGIWLLIPYDFLLVRKSAYPSILVAVPQNSQLIVFRKLQVFAIGSGGGGLVVSPVALGLSHHPFRLGALLPRRQNTSFPTH